ncbi:uncharacterized protein LOC121735185 [Aricia agestis]|uniref:uncharacterized protein LOC121735185 n=1 Tax=Aricia agestis TaxID=91739 RepID=UPI001C207D5F|nr:uncharacterized protein LOC121735185 [Aricia agestis]
MVPSGSLSSFTCSGISSNIAAISRIAQDSIQRCKDCQKNMAAIPPSAFSAAKIRETQRNMKVSNVKKGNDEKTKFFNTNLLELTPLKYNSKLMNSIWGLYNRYSPHNVKNVNDAFTFNAELPSAANSAGKADAKLTLPAANVWINASQSH